MKGIATNHNIITFSEESGFELNDIDNNKLLVDEYIVASTGLNHVEKLHNIETFENKAFIKKELVESKSVTKIIISSEGVCIISNGNQELRPDLFELLKQNIRDEFSSCLPSDTLEIFLRDVLEYKIEAKMVNYINSNDVKPAAYVYTSDNKIVNNKNFTFLVYFSGIQNSLDALIEAANVSENLLIFSPFTNNPFFDSLSSSTITYVNELNFESLVKLENNHRLSSTAVLQVLNNNLNNGFIIIDKNLSEIIVKVKGKKHSIQTKSLLNNNHYGNWNYKFNFKISKTVLEKHYITFTDLNNKNYNLGI